jgi:cytochrome c oxidase cbb3-type subunit I/II
VGGKYSDDWHYHHLLDPRDTSVGSIMPSYAFLAEATFDAGDIPAHMRAMARVGVPYTEAEIQGAPEAARAQAEAISARLKEKGITCPPDREIVALIAYLQRLGTDIENAPAPETESGAGGGA